ncbi:hypothetical protein CQW23_06146 [Capsicum baccatum]|uniref:Uncharacterized protein n=1 Tax=Capsicum baccatum TaxID=33114 RepID=A0A2G2X2G4_CAPBA|nr:hypothetical protein CQW23_06146 [Capsicum baccatum]
MISSWSERMISHTGTETLPRLLQEAAVGNFLPWDKNLTEQCHVENPEQTTGDKPEKGEDDVKSSFPLCPGQHTCYNGRDKGVNGKLVRSSMDCTWTVVGVDGSSRVPSSKISGEEDQVGPCEQLDALSPFNPLSKISQKKRKENPWTNPIISTL